MSAEITITSDLSEAQRVRELIEESLRASKYSETDIVRSSIALEEALVNAIKHGNQMDPEKRVYVHYTVTDERFDIRIADEGEGFNPGWNSDPTDPVTEEGPGGRGLLLMHHFMTEVQYHGRGNVVTMTKIRETADS